MLCVIRGKALLEGGGGQRPTKTRPPNRDNEKEYELRANRISRQKGEEKHGARSNLSFVKGRKIVAEDELSSDTRLKCKRNFQRAHRFLFCFSFLFEELQRFQTFVE